MKTVKGKERRDQKDSTRYEDGTKIPVPGIAQNMGYVNRQQYRHSIMEMRHKKKANANTFQLMAPRVAPISPYHITRKRKLKGYQKQTA